MFEYYILSCSKFQIVWFRSQSASIIWSQKNKSKSYI